MSLETVYNLLVLHHLYLYDALPNELDLFFPEQSSVSFQRHDHLFPLFIRKSWVNVWFKYVLRVVIPFWLDASQYFPFVRATVVRFSFP